MFPQLEISADDFVRCAGAGKPVRCGKFLGKLFALYSQARGKPLVGSKTPARSEEHTSELQSLTNLVCRLLLEKKKKKKKQTNRNIPNIKENKNYKLEQSSRQIQNNENEY